MRPLLILLASSTLCWAEGSSYRREDVEQLGARVAPMVEIRDPQPRDERRIRSGGRVLLKPLPQGDLMLRATRRDASVGYWLDW